MIQQKAVVGIGAHVKQGSHQLLQPTVDVKAEGSIVNRQPDKIEQHVGALYSTKLGNCLALGWGRGVVCVWQRRRRGDQDGELTLSVFAVDHWSYNNNNDDVDAHQPDACCPPLGSGRLSDSCCWRPQYPGPAVAGAECQRDPARA